MDWSWDWHTPGLDFEQKPVSPTRDETNSEPVWPGRAYHQVSRGDEESPAASQRASRGGFCGRGTLSSGAAQDHSELGRLVQ